MTGEQPGLFPEQPSFRCMLLDPPWNETGGQGGSWGESHRGADRHYPLLRTRQMPDVIRRSGLWLPAEHAHCWMWVTDNFLEHGLWLMRTLGFTYVRTMVWVKMAEPHAVAQRAVFLGRRQEGSPIAFDPPPYTTADEMFRDATPQIGLGKYLRGSHELCLFGVRGKGLDGSVRAEAKNVPSVVFGRRTKHSKKPESAYVTIERVSRGPRVEFFARSERPGWTSWGNEIAA